MSIAHKKAAFRKTGGYPSRIEQALRLCIPFRNFGQVLPEVAPPSMRFGNR
jgi:hypothetical protein